MRRSACRALAGKVYKVTLTAAAKSFDQGRICVGNYQAHDLVPNLCHTLTCGSDEGSPCQTNSNLRLLHTPASALFRHRPASLSHTPDRLRNMGRLKIESPVPSDIVIAQATVPTHISEVAKSIGLAPEEYDLYGTTKAKVSLSMNTSMHCNASHLQYQARHEVQAW